ncbi:uncharacterized protein LOC124991544 [Sciurus carolinensis]|uniref:uncharacterized protein LOC124991544 n=1 Tax=Sciurus carolinensis TaxID=30640 RepID=UPI001FB28F8A|nr:uncharacterized protein LOC124991544 [Sciurus carolinensis]
METEAATPEQDLGVCAALSLPNPGLGVLQGGGEPCQAPWSPALREWKQVALGPGWRAVLGRGGASWRRLVSSVTVLGALRDPCSLRPAKPDMDPSRAGTELGRSWGAVVPACCCQVGTALTLGRPEQPHPCISLELGFRDLLALRPPGPEEAPGGCTAGVQAWPLASPRERSSAPGGAWRSPVLRASLLSISLFVLLEKSEGERREEGRSSSVALLVSTCISLPVSAPTSCSVCQRPGASGKRSAPRDRRRAACRAGPGREATPCHCPPSPRPALPCPLGLRGPTKPQQEKKDEWNRASLSE